MGKFKSKGKIFRNARAIEGETLVLLRLGIKQYPSDLRQNETKWDKKRGGGELVIAIIGNNFEKQEQNIVMARE